MTEPNIEKVVYNEARRDGYWYVLSQMAYYNWVADFIAWAPKKGILEIEIKRTWEDYNNDKRKICDYRASREIKDRLRRKTRVGWSKQERLPPVTKYEFLRGLYPCLWRPNYFVYAAPAELADRIANDIECPSKFGIWSIYTSRNGHCYVQKIRKVTRLCTITPEWQARFEKDALKRALAAMDVYFGYKGFVPEVMRQGLKLIG